MLLWQLGLGKLLGQGGYVQCFGTESFQKSRKQFVSSSHHLLALPRVGGGGGGSGGPIENQAVPPGWACARGLGATLRSPACGDAG